MTGQTNNMLNAETAGLVRAFLKGDQQAFDRLVMLYQTRIYNLAFQYLKNTEEAKDTTQDIFVTVYRSLSKLKEASKFKSWLYQIAINHCRNRYKSLKRKGYFSSSSIDDPDTSIQLTGGDSPEVSMERSNTIKLVRQAIDAMGEQEKEIIMLRDIQQLSYEEISTILDLPLGTVKSRLNRARLALKDRLQDSL